MRFLPLIGTFDTLKVVDAFADEDYLQAGLTLAWQGPSHWLLIFCHDTEEESMTVLILYDAQPQFMSMVPNSKPGIAVDENPA